MGFFDRLFNSKDEQTRPKTQRYGERKNVKIKCASCGSSELYRANMETLSCRSCGRDYSLDEARKTMGTVYCRDCIQHSVNLFDDGILERCNIWGLDNCSSGCDRKETTPRYRWTDANRWEKD